MSAADTAQAHSSQKEFEQTFGMRTYRSLCRFLLWAFGRLIVGAMRIEGTEKAMRALSELPFSGSKSPVFWFHAASVGELESLWPLVERASRFPDSRLVLTVFSSSAHDHLHRSARKLDGHPPLFVGYSPLEGQWADALQGAKPHLFVTAKYEAWPEMWDALGRLDIPLAIIGAKPRSSLMWARRILGFFAGRIPQILFFSFDADNSPGLRRRFPAAQIYLGSDPRWDRVFQRSENSPPRITELRNEFADLPRPWGVLGSAWPSDITVIPVDGDHGVPGTLWVVPHKTDARSVSEMEILLRDRGYTPVRTAASDLVRPAGKIAVLVDEMGFLAELYRMMDWAFIGGGFGSNIHSTIEPAIYGLPIYGGPKGQEKFDEIPILKKQAQLRIFGDQREGAFPIRPGSDFRRWLQTALDIASPSQWKALNETHRGASDRIWKLLVEHLESRSSG